MFQILTIYLKIDSPEIMKSNKKISSIGQGQVVFELLHFEKLPHF